MAGRDASRVQLDFPDLVADLIRQLRLTGTLGLLELSDQVTPVYIVAQREGALQVTVAPITFESAEITQGDAWSPAAFTVIADTGALAAGTYDLQLQLSITADAALVGGPLVIEHRNAANLVTLATLLSLHVGVSDIAAATESPIFSYVLALNERLRIVTGSTAWIGGVTGHIYAALRPTP